MTTAFDKQRRSNISHNKDSDRLTSANIREKPQSIRPITLESNVQVQHLSMSVRPIPKHPLWLRCSKRAVDASAAIVFFLLFGWLFLVLWVGVLATSGGPALYSQKRYGKDGKLFKFYKFRSMVSDADQVLQSHLADDPLAKSQWDEFQKLDTDPRVTKFGALIRKTSMDELPQFWNVLVGDMSLVGPRPCMTFQKDLYGQYWEHYTAVRPGITGLWQVSGRNNLSYKKRIALDVKYVETLSIRRDLFIFLKTLWVVATGHGSR